MYAYLNLMYTLNIFPFYLEIIDEKTEKKILEFQYFLYHIIDISAITLGM